MNTDKYKFLTQVQKRFAYTFNFKHEDEDVIGYDPPIYFNGYIDRLEISVLNERGKIYFDFLVGLTEDNDRSEITSSKIVLKIDPVYSFDFTNVNSAIVFRDLANKLLEYFEGSSQEIGFYGAFKYEAVGLFEEVMECDGAEPLFKFGMYDKVVAAPQSGNGNFGDEGYSVSDPMIKYNNEQYVELCEVVGDHFRSGDAFEVVLANKVSANFSGSVIALYKDYCNVSPTSYQYFFDFGSEFLVGCSPEMLVSVDQERNVETHPISGTMPRSEDVFEDHNNLVELLNSPKEKAELDMLIDLARNDLAKVCEAGVRVSSYRDIQKLSYVYHTFARVNGILNPQYTALDAVFACMPAGTLSGAPKVEAMKIISRLEKEARNYYGGCVGYLRQGDILNMAITIRSAVVKKDSIEYKAGATLLNDSDFSMEYKETINKMGAFLKLVQPIQIPKIHTNEKSFAHR